MSNRSVPDLQKDFFDRALNGSLPGAGAGGQVDTVVAGNDIIVDNTDPINPIVSYTGATPNKEVIVNEASDFPAPIAGQIFLEDYTHYLIGDDVSYADELVGGVSTSIAGLSTFSPLLTYTGVGTWIQSTGNTLQISTLAVRVPNASKIFALTGGVLLMRDVQFVGSAGTTIGTFDEVAFNLADDVGFSGVGQGITLTNTTDQVFNWSMVSSSTVNPAFVGMDLGTSTFNTFVLDDFRISAVPGAVGLAGLPSGGNILTNSIASVSNCSWLGGMTGLVGISNDDYRWAFNGNNLVPDTMPDALISLVGNVTVTPITTINTPVKVVGTFVCERESHFTCDTTGRATYNAERSVASPVDVIASVSSASGSPDATLYVAVNGVVVPSTGQITVTSSKPQSISTMWQHTFVTGDYIEMFVENNSGTQDMIALNAMVRVN